MNVVAPVRDADTPEALGPGYAASDKVMQPSPYWGDEKIWTSKANNHNGMFDKKGRVWFAAAVPRTRQPRLLQEGLRSSLGQAFPLERTNRQITMLDPKTGQYTFVDTCFRTHHLQFGYDANDTLWTSGGGPVVGWINTKIFDETGDVAKVAGLDAIHSRHQRQRQARRVRRSQAAGRPDQGQADHCRLLRRDAEPGGRFDLGLVPELFQAP